jgi:hypothetical protein
MRREGQQIRYWVKEQNVPLLLLLGIIGIHRTMMSWCAPQLVLDSPSTLASGDELYGVVHGGSRAAALVVHVSRDRSGASNSSSGDSLYRDRSVGAVATAIRTKHRSTIRTCKNGRDTFGLDIFA